MIAYLIGLALIPTAAIGVPWVCGRVTARGDCHPQPPADYPRALAFEQEAHRKTRAELTAENRILKAENAALRGQVRRMEGVQ